MIKHDFQNDAHRLAIHITSWHRNNICFFCKIHKKYCFFCCKKSEKQFGALSVRRIFFWWLIFGPIFCYTDFTELYVLQAGWHEEWLHLCLDPHLVEKEKKKKFNIERERQRERLLSILSIRSIERDLLYILSLYEKWRERFPLYSFYMKNRVGPVLIVLVYLVQ